MKINVRENHYIFAILSGRPCIQGDYLNLGAVPVGHIEILGGGGAGVAVIIFFLKTFT